MQIQPNLCRTKGLEVGLLDSHLSRYTAPDRANTAPTSHQTVKRKVTDLQFLDRLDGRDCERSAQLLRSVAVNRPGIDTRVAIKSLEERADLGRALLASVAHGQSNQLDWVPSPPGTVREPWEVSVCCMPNGFLQVKHRSRCVLAIRVLRRSNASSL